MNPEVKYNQGDLRDLLMFGDEELGIEPREHKDELAYLTGRIGSGQIDACHVVPKRVLKKIFPYGAQWDPGLGFWQPVGRLEIVTAKTVSLDEILMDTDNALLGSRTLHDEWDDKHAAMIPREQLPAHVEKFATDHGVRWWLTEYYERRAA